MVWGLQDLLERYINHTLTIDCMDGLMLLPDGCINALITSPPYAQQRVNQYGGVSEADYPDWTVKWCSLVWDKLAEDGSLFINIRPHIKKGIISDYVLKTRIALREYGWKECEELIWIKPDSPPLGSVNRPRRAWESILWFSKTNKPKCYPKANGVESNRLGFEASKFEQGGKSHIHAGQNKATAGISRSRDYIEVGTSKVEKGFNHPAMFPPEVPSYLMQLSTDIGDLVVDPFIGSGTTGRAAQRLGRKWIGFEINNKYAPEGAWRDPQDGKGE